MTNDIDGDEAVANTIGCAVGVPVATPATCPTKKMKTIVLQSFRTHEVPPWIATCMASVRAWATSAGWDYECMDDAFFALAPDWTRWRCKENIYAVTDISRLVWARSRLEETWERVIWADADMLVFAPQDLQIAEGICHGFAGELFLHVDGHGKTTPTHGINNALMAFERGDPILGAYLEACYQCLRALPPGPVPRTALGPALLTRFAAAHPLTTIERIGLFSLTIMQQIADGGGPLTHEYLARSPYPPAAANLCHFQRNALTADMRPGLDRLYEMAVQHLIETRGAVLAARPQAV